MKTPIAWRNLTHDKRKLLIAVSGVAFAVVLMFQQTGFEHALFDSTVEIVKQTDCDVIIFNRARFALSSELRFKRDYIDMAAGIKGVESVSPLFIDNTIALFQATNTETTTKPKPRPIRVMGFDLKHSVWASEEINSQIQKLQTPNSALIDRLSKPEFGFQFDDQVRVDHKAGVQSCPISPRK